MKMSVTVFLIAVLMITACFTGGTICFLQGIVHVDISSDRVGMVIFAATLLFFFAAATIMAKNLLYRKETADLQVIGGVRYGSFIEAMRSGKQATWPFAKLLIAKERLWLHTPWGTQAWDYPQLPFMRLNRSLLFPALTIRAPGVTILLFPWHRKRVEKALKMLGHDISGGLTDPI